MNATKKIVLTALIPAVAFASFAYGAEKAPAVKAASQPVQKKAVPPKVVTLESALAFLPASIGSINGRSIKKADFAKWVAPQVPAQVLGQIPEQEFKKFITTRAIPAYVEYEVLLERVLKDGFKPNAQRVRQAMEAQLKQIPPKQLSQLEKQLGKKPEALIQEQSAQPLIQNYFMIREWEEKNLKAVISEKEAKDFYAKNTKEFSTPEMIEASHILIQVEPGKLDDKAAQKKAADILARVKKGEDFAKLAKENSSCPSKAQGGKLGSFPKGAMVPEFEKAAFALKKGETSGIVKTKFGYHIIRVTGKTPAGTVPFEKVQGDISKFLQAQKLEAVRKAAIEKAKKDFKVILPKF